MVVRVRLSTADLGRVRLASDAHPLGVTVIGAQALRGQQTKATLPTLRARHERAARSTAVLHHLVPKTGYIPDFLTPLGGVESVEAGIAALRSTSAATMRAELLRAYAREPATPLRRRLVAGDREVLDQLTTALHRYFDAVFAPDWAALRRLALADIARRARELALSGVDTLLNGLHPGIRWRGPVLEVDTWWDGEASPDGHGVVISPSLFAGPLPRLMVGPGQPALLVYPVAPPATLAGPRADPLRALLGRTRASVVRRLALPGRHTTSTLATALAISPASASEHAAALRAAGLVGTHRAGRAVEHHLTALGAEMLRASDGTVH
jgi:hypothetical protein